jgi:NAD(P)-dependent dehydrogenase (short-subunit alcohol dehydrogenase family)
MSIKGKTALVTGAASGIGLECVKALLKTGALVSYIGYLHCNVGYTVAQWLRHCATNRKIAGSISVGFIGIFH